MDQLLYWNDVALEANRVSFTNTDKPEQGGPTLSSRALGIVHLAMHDAYVGTSGTTTFGAYLATSLPPASVGASVDAAIAGAAHTSLVSLYPSQKAFFDQKINSLTHVIGNRSLGHAYGCLIAQLILEKRSNDPSNSDSGYITHTGRGVHKPDPDNNAQGFLAPFYGKRSALFASTTRHDLLAPPLDNTEYNNALKQVRSKGIAAELMGTLPSGSSKRTVDETLIGIFWGYDGANEIGTPPRLYNQVVRALAISKGNTLEQNVRLFALVNTAMADAGILAWEQKYKHNFWRPVNGIREHDKSMGTTGTPNNNINNNCDPLWLPLGAPMSNENGKKNFTPNFPAYPSGHATFGAAAFHITRLFYGIVAGDRTTDTLFQNCDFVSDEFNGIAKDNNNTTRPCHTRNFPGGLWQMILENAWSRIYLGVHWSFDAFKTDTAGNPIFDQNVGGVDLGLKIAEDIFSNNMIATS